VGARFCVERRGAPIIADEMGWQDTTQLRLRALSSCVAAAGDRPSTLRLMEDELLTRLAWDGLARRPFA